MFLFGSGFKREWAFAAAIALAGVTGLVPAVGRAHDFGGVSTSEEEDEPNEEGKCGRSTAPCGCEPPPQTGGFDGGQGGDPVWFYDGRMTLTQIDLTVGMGYPIAITRRYRSTTSFDSALGYAWAFDHDHRLFEYPDGSVLLRNGCGRRDRFVPAGGGFATSVDGIQGALTQLANGDYVLALANGERNYFDADGRLTALENRSGQRHELTYDPRGSLPLVGTSKHSVDPTQPMVVAYQPQLARIAERSADGQLTGAFVDFYYNESTGRLTHLIASDGRRIDYTHDSIHGNLTGVIGSGDYSQEFAYADPNNAHLLTTYISGDGAEPAVNIYDAEGRVTQQTIGSESMSISYQSATTRSVTRVVKGPSGATLHTRTHSYQFEGQYLVKEINALGHELRRLYTPSRDLEREEVWQKEASGALVLFKATNWTYDGQGRQLTESVTLDSGEIVTTTNTYDHGWVANVETTSSLSSQVFQTKYTFYRDGNGVPVNIHEAKRRRDDGVFAVTTYTYCSAADVANVAAQCPYERLLKSIDGPRTDVADVMGYAYYAETDISGCGSTGPCHRKGDLRRVTNALGHAAEVVAYDGAGRPVRTQDPNGVITQTTYHVRGWPLTRTVLGNDPTNNADDAVESFTYDARGNLISQTDADGVVITYVYDARNRLTEIHDAGGGRLIYSSDSDGNRLSEEIRDSGNILRRKRTFAYDKLGRLISERDAQNRATTYEYDAASQQTAIVDASGHRTQHIYDDLGRLTKTVADAAPGGIQATTQFVYDAADHLRSVVDPKGLTTTYVYNALGQLTQLQSPDTGTTYYTYDLAGSRLAQTDARGITATNAYDALGRLTAITYADSTYDVGFFYDQDDATTHCAGSFEVGRLTTVTDETGTSVYCYGRQGSVTLKKQTVDGVVMTVAYNYSPANRLSEMTYSSGADIAYTRDAQGRITGIDRIDGGNPVPIVTGAAYLPFGPVMSLSFAGGATQAWTYDQNYWIDAISGTALNLDYITDAQGNLSELPNAVSAEARVYGYDALSRLTSVKDGTNAVLEAFTYDDTGNRLSKQASTTTQMYSYPAISHRLTSIGTTSRMYDAMGSLEDAGDGRTFEYDPRQRLAAIRQSNNVIQINRYNGKGERVAKTGAKGSISRYVYSEAGQLLTDLKNTALAEHRQEYVWLDDRPVAVLQHAGAYVSEILDIHSDHLGSPRAVSRPAAAHAVAWSWPLTGAAFGEHVAIEDPDGDGVALTIGLRYPGQYFDQDTGLRYNYFRNYESATGRYIESDPLGLKGGVSTYAYTLNNPLTKSDKFGLITLTELDYALVAHFFTGLGETYIVDQSWCGSYLADPAIFQMMLQARRDVRKKTKSLAATLNEGESEPFRIGRSQNNYLRMETTFSFGDGRDEIQMRCVGKKTNCRCATASCSGGVGRQDWFTDPLDLHQVRGFGDTAFDRSVNPFGVPFIFKISCNMSYSTTQCI